ncbi:MAG TPA: hypothetical protein VFC44_14305 [Candidatus Saccharimonadales bacterium]|nr:hypothetical protein [Candidatus Saccharimonadales bacterium]
MVALTLLFAPDLFPRPGSHIRVASLLGHWAIICLVAGATVVLFAFVTQTDERLSDEEIVARERRKWKIARISGPLWGLAIVLVSSMLFSYFPRAPALGTYFPAILLLTGFLVAFWLMPARVAFSAHIQRKRMEEFQKHNLFNMAWTIFFAGLSCFAVMPALRSKANYLSGFLILFLIMASTTILYGYGWLRPRSNPARDDEWARQLRARAARIGYMTLMIGVGVIYLGGLYAPPLVPLLIRSVLFLGIALPATAYLILDWRAGG